MEFRAGCDSAPQSPTVSLNSIQDFWKAHEAYIPKTTSGTLIEYQSNPRYVELPWLHHFFQTFKPAAILECGSSHIDRNFFGAYWHSVLSRALEAYGIDIMPLRSGRYRDSVPDAEVRRLKTQVGDLRQTGFNANKFDMIFCISTIEHVGFDIARVPTDDDPSTLHRVDSYPANVDEHREDFKALSELIRILKPGGVLVLTIPCNKHRGYLKHVDSMGFTATEVSYDRERISQLTSSVSAQVLSLDYYEEREEGGWFLVEGDISSSAKQGLACLALQKK